MRKDFYKTKNYTPVDHPIRECNWCYQQFKPRTSHQWFCNKKCYKYYGKKYLGHSQHSKWKSVSRLPLPKEIRYSKKIYCENCYFLSVNKCQLDVDHIDGNHNNNELNNLQTLCSNCHRLKTWFNRDNIK